MASTTSRPLGIDVGGTGIKGAPVDLQKGAFADERVRIDTPERSTPAAVSEVIEQIVEHFDEQIGDEAIGITIPGVVQDGVVRTAANIDPSWKGHPIEEELEARLGRDITVLNDADAAGIAEWHYGAAADLTDGLVVVTTLGTGIGSALIHDGVLVPNTEFGHFELDGAVAETRAANSAREREDLSFEEWSARLQRYYAHLEFLLWPDLFVVGGGISKKADKFLPLLDLRTPIVPAQLRNAAGIVGAAREAHDRAAGKGALNT